MLGVVTIAVNVTVARLPTMPPAAGDFITVGEKRIHHVDQPGAGLPVVMLPGLPGTYRDFDPLMDRLRGMHVVRLDRPGFGWSDGGWLSYQDQIDLLHELLNRQHLTPAVVVGHSFGGSVGLGLARRYPNDVAALVIVAAAAGGMRAHPIDLLRARYLRFTRLPLIRSVVGLTYGNIALRLSAHFGTRNAFAPDGVDPSHRHRALAVALTPGNLNAYANELLEYDATMRWLDDNVGGLRVPSVHIAAKDDALVPYGHAQRLAEVLPQSALITVDGGHMIPYTHPEVVAAEVRRAASAGS